METYNKTKIDSLINGKLTVDTTQYSSNPQTIDGILGKAYADPNHIVLFEAMYFSNASESPTGSTGNYFNLIVNRHASNRYTLIATQLGGETAWIMQAVGSTPTTR